MQAAHDWMPQFCLIYKAQTETVAFGWQSVGSCAGAACFGLTAKRLAGVLFSC